MKKLLLLFCLLPLFAYAESEPGVNFVRGLSWSQVLEKAKKENKWIFMDCVTTWCAPCKQMDKSTFPDPEVAAYVNKHYIAVRAQMDRSAADTEEVINWYGDASRIKRKYAIDGYPTLLFFSPDGKLMHRTTLAYSPKAFLQLAKDAKDPKKQYNTLVQAYDPSKASLDELRKKAFEFRYQNSALAEKILGNYVSRLAPEVRTNRETLDFMGEFSNFKGPQGVARNFISGLKGADLKDSYNRKIVIAFRDLPEAQEKVDDYIKTLNDAEIMTEDTLNLVLTTTLSSRSAAFQYVYSHVDAINKMRSRRGAAQDVVVSVIATEIVKPEIRRAQDTGTEPDWKRLEGEITSKYGDWYSNFLLSYVKYEWFNGKNARAEAFRHLVRYYDVYGIDVEDSFNLNQTAWGIFLRSSDPAELEQALVWSNRAISMQPTANLMDTYANILYKLNRKDLAITWQMVAQKLDPEDKNIGEALEKMKRGEPTWPVAAPAPVAAR